MAASPLWEVYRGGEYVASCRYAEGAAALVAAEPSDAEVRYRHRLVVWREGAEAFGAGESYDRAAQVMHGASRKPRAATARWWRDATAASTRAPSRRGRPADEHLFL